MVNKNYPDKKFKFNYRKNFKYLYLKSKLVNCNQYNTKLKIFLATREQTKFYKFVNQKLNVFKTLRF